MAQNTNADESRTETKRFADDVDAADLIEGDRIDPALVASTFEALGSTRSAQPDAPDTKLAAITATNRMDDVHSALLVDGGSGIIIRAGRHDSQQAWSQQEADWKVYDVGTSIVVDEVHELTLADSDDPVEDEAGYVTEWAEIVIGDPANGYSDYDDDRKLDGRALTLSDFDGRRAVATISLE